MKHVVIFNDHWCSGGVESLWTNLIKNITTDEFDFTILATQKETDIYDDMDSLKRGRYDFFFDNLQ